MTACITIRKPDDWHLHVRDGATLKAVMPFTATRFGGAILMPNLVPPVITLEKSAWTAPPEGKVEGPDEKALIYRGGESIEWKVVSG